MRSRFSTLFTLAQAWHERLRQRVTRTEKLRLQALKADNLEAYMKIVEENKNETLTMLLGKTNDLLVHLGAAVQLQKGVLYGDDDHLQDSVTDLLDLSASRTDKPAKSLHVEDATEDGSNSKAKSTNLLESQRNYNFVVHSIQEKVES